MTTGLVNTHIDRSIANLGLFELVSLLSQQFNAFEAYILLLHAFSFSWVPVNQLKKKKRKVGEMSLYSAIEC